MEQKNLVFIISAPRSGSTMLQRILDSHTEIMAPPEPHMLTPLAYLGYYYKVDQAEFNVNQASIAIKDFVGNLPGEENDYLDACRAYSNILYERMLSTTKKRMFVDKTPDYGWKILPFIKKLYPNANYIVLARHPLAILSSHADKHHNYGSFDRTIFYRNVLEQFVPSIARFLRDTDVRKCHVLYEDFVYDPRQYLEKIFKFLNVEMDESIINYGNKEHVLGLGDKNVDQYSRPVTTSVDKWVAELTGDKHKFKVAEKIVSKLDCGDLELWGYEKENMLTNIFKTGITPLKKTNKLPWINDVNYMVLNRARELICRMRLRKVFLKLQMMFYHLSK